MLTHELQSTKEVRSLQPQAVVSCWAHHAHHAIICSTGDGYQGVVQGKAYPRKLLLLREEEITTLLRDLEFVSSFLAQVHEKLYSSCCFRLFT